MKRKSILSIALMSFFAPSIFAEGVSDDVSDLATPTITGISGKTVSYTDSAGKSQTFYIDSSITSDFSVSENTTATDWLGYQTIEKFLLNADGTYTSKYFDIKIEDFGTSATATSDGTYIYYWDSEGKLTSSSTAADGTTANSIAFTVYGNKSKGEDHIAETADDGAGLYNSDTGVTYSVNFIKNVASDLGGGVYNSGTMTSITGEFIDNTAANQGGGIYNIGTITSITGDFLLNTSTNSSGGAIYNYGSSASIDTIVGDFIANSSSTYGGAIHNSTDATINLIVGDFIGNSVSTYFGGAIFNASATIGTIVGNFIGNTATSSAGGAIANTGSTSKIYSINGDFIANTAENNGGAIYNYNGATITAITGDFVDNNSNSNGGAIFNDTASASIGTISGDFISNIATTNGGAIYNTSTIESVTGDFISNYAGNYGGAIYNKGTISLDSTSKSITFEGNYSGTSTSSAIFNASSGSDDATINFKASDDNTIVVNDGISGFAGTSEYQILNIESGTVEFNNSVAHNTVNVADGATLSLGSYAGGMKVDSDSYTTSALASLNNVEMTVESGATLSIGTDSSENSVMLSNGSTITMESGSSILFEAYASLTLDSTSSIDFEDLKAIIVDISNFEVGTYEYTLISTENSTYTSDDIYNALSDEDITVQTSNSDIEASDISISTSGSNVVLTVTVASTAAVPEPSTYAMIFGLVSLGFVAYRRRK